VRLAQSDVPLAAPAATDSGVNDPAVEQHEVGHDARPRNCRVNSRKLLLLVVSLVLTLIIIIFALGVRVAVGVIIILSPGNGQTGARRH